MGHVQVHRCAKLRPVCRQLSRGEEAMNAADLRDWLAQLERSGEMWRHEGPFDLHYDVPHWLTQQDGLRAVRVDGAGPTGPVTLVGNTINSRRQLAAALGVEADALLQRYLTAIERPLPAALVAVGEAPVLQQATSAPALEQLPAPHHHAGDSGPYLTAAVIIAKDEETGVHNWSIHRLQINGAREMGILMLPRHLWHLYQRAESQDRDLPVAVVIGLPPAYLLASQAITAFGVDESAIAGALLGAPVPLVRSPRYGIDVPAVAEYLLEGRIVAHRRAQEGPFGEFPRTYGPRSEKPVVEIDAVSHRPDPIYQTILPASREHMLLGAIPREAALLRSTRHASPNVEDVRLTFAGGCRYHAVVRMRPRMRGEAKNVILAALAGSNEVKRAVVVDDDIDIDSAEDVEWAIATRVQPERDLLVVPGALGSALDPSAEADGLTGKWGIDATVPVSADRSRYECITLPTRDRRG